ncbi:DUF6985 domain-containing protein [Hymenobacter terrenus]|uniref:DUF6985 domain-containing protein n=1 Tax=Hymenobacter terrenus TaxID=1629124 RepID=UPI0006975A09|nr:hypothetical protein [Hymenobacter terrenus]
MPEDLNTDNSPAMLYSAGIPGLNWDEYRWEGIISLPEWEAFNKGTGAWKPVRAATRARRRKREKRADQHRFEFPPSDDSLQLSVYPPFINEKVLPSPEQVRAYQLLLAHEGELLTAVLAEFKKHWSEIICIYDHSDEDPNRHSMPFTLRAPEELCGLLELHHVYIKRTHTDGVAHIGLALSCDWDTEHGLGVYTHHGRVLGLGSGDLAFSSLSSAFKFWQSRGTTE